MDFTVLSRRILRGRPVYFTVIFYSVCKAQLGIDLMFGNRLIGIASATAANNIDVNHTPNIPALSSLAKPMMFLAGEYTDRNAKRYLSCISGISDRYMPAFGIVL